MTHPAPTRRVQKLLLGAAFIAFVIYGLAGFTAAQTNPAHHADIVFISDAGTLSASHPLWVGLWFQLDKGWHVYWKNPGDSGEPPRIAWKLPAGFRAGEIEWPRPMRLGTGSIIDYGYEDRVLLMAPIFAPPGTSSSSSATISAEVNYIVCREICVPGKASLSLAMPLSGDQSTHLAEWQKIFQQARSELPKPAPASWRISAVADKGRFILFARGARERHVVFFPLDPSVIDNSAPQDVVPTDDGFTITLRASDELLKATPFLRGLLEFEDGRTFQIAAPVGARLR